MALATGLSKDCAANSGGIKRIIIADEASVASVTYDTAGDIVTGITMATGGRFN